MWIMSFMLLYNYRMAGGRLVGLYEMKYYGNGMVIQYLSSMISTEFLVNNMLDF